MSKIAPTLAEFADPNRKYLIEHKREKARAELRALLGVVRSAQWWVDADMRFEKGTPAAKLHEAMTRLARLSRASGKGGGR